MMNMPSNKVGRYMLADELFFPPAWRLQMSYELIADRFIPADYIEIEPESVMPKQRQLILHWMNDDVTVKKIRKINLPVLILNGESDAVIPSGNSIILLRAIPHAQLFRWKQGGHAMIYQFPNQMARIINSFIASYH
jgi:pimeloyl-ACP methyl ester carboxylesterase